jgi:hypothetical protein
MLKINCQLRIKSLFSPSPVIDFAEVYVDQRQQHLFLPSSIIDQTELMPLLPRCCFLNGITKTFPNYDAVHLIRNNRFCSIDVVGGPDLELPLVGKIPLQMLDFVVDPQQRCLVGKPEHNGEELHELLLQYA